MAGEGHRRALSRFRVGKGPVPPLIAAGLIVCVMSVLLLFSLTKLNQLNARPDQNIAWHSSQLSVEYYRFLAAIQSAKNSGDYDDLALRFDLFYSRLGILTEGAVAELLASDPSYNSLMSGLRSSVEDMDESMRALQSGDVIGLGGIERQALGAGLAINALAPKIQHILAETSTKQRQETLQQLQWAAAASSAMILLLVVLTAVLFNQHRRMERSRERLAQLSQDLGVERDKAYAANRAKSDFLANMSHELRTPLNAIIGFSEILEGEFYGKHQDPRYREYAGDIVASARHLLGIINDILDLSKIEAGKLELVEEKVMLPDVVTDAIRLVGGRDHDGTRRFDVRLEPSPAPFLGDRRALLQVFVNLLANASKFTRDDGRIAVIFDDRGQDGFAVAIQDDGIGMSNEEILVALRPFEQIDDSYRRRFEGTGLGLPLTKSLVELHDGRLEIASQSGVGTTVTVVLPRTRFLAPEPQATVTSAA